MQMKARTSMMDAEVDLGVSAAIHRWTWNRILHMST